MQHEDDRLVQGRLPSRGVRWSWFLPWSFGVLAVAALAAVVLDWLFVRGWYVLLIVPMTAALALAAAVHTAVTFGHCRNRLVAALLGFVAGTMLYLGQYQIDMVRQLGPPFALRLDLLPRYIAFRKTVERQEKIEPQINPKPAANAPKNVDVFGNWFLFVLEFSFVLFAATYSGWCAAGRPYCDRCRRWMRREAAFFPPGTGPDIVRAVDENRLQSLAGLPAFPPPQQGAYTAVVVAWCPPRPGGVSDCPAHLSVKAVRRGGGPSQYSQLDAVLGRTLLALRPLSSEQVSVLRPRFPALQRSVRGEELQPSRAEQEVVARGARSAAEVRPIANMDAGKILSQRMIVIGNLLSLAPLALLAGGLATALLGFFLLKSPVLAVLGGAMLFVGCLAVRDVGWLSRRYLMRRARTAIGLRGDAWVRPDDPEAVFMQVVPRERWGKLMLDTASDVGFVKLDSRRRELLFEGDRQRYRVPAHAILDCQVEKIVYGPAGEIETCIFLSVLRARGVEGVFEAPLGQRAPMSRKTASARRQWAEQFSRRVLQLAAQEHPLRPL